MRTCNLHKGPVPKVTDLSLFCKDSKSGYWKYKEKGKASPEILRLVPQVFKILFVSFLFPHDRELQRHPVAFFPLTGHEIHYIIFIPDKPIYLYPPLSKLAHVIAATYKEQRFTSSYFAGFEEKVCSICLLLASWNLQSVL